MLPLPRLALSRAGPAVLLTPYGIGQHNAVRGIAATAAAKGQSINRIQCGLNIGISGAQVPREPSRGNWDFRSRLVICSAAAAASLVFVGNTARAVRGRNLPCISSPAVHVRRVDAPIAHQVPVVDLRGEPNLYVAPDRIGVMVMGGITDIRECAVLARTCRIRAKSR